MRTSLLAGPALAIFACAFSAQPMFAAGNTITAKAAVPTPVPTPTPGPVSKEVIVFSSMDHAKLLLGLMDSDGSHRLFLDHAKNRFVDVAVPRTDGDDWAPAISKDGKWIAFYSNRSGAANLWLMNSDGSGQHALTHEDKDIVKLDTRIHGQISFSPDSKQLAYISQGNLWIYDMETDLANTLSQGQGLNCLDWSPDGKFLAFVANNSLYWASPKSPVTRTLVENNQNWPTLQVEPKAGKQVLFFRNGAWTVDVETKATKRIFSSLLTPNSLRYSPDGGSICLLAPSPDHVKEVFRIGLDGKGEQVTQGGAEDCFFSTDGKHLYFLRKGMLWTIGLNGKGSKPITHVAVYDPVLGTVMLAQESK